jgi:CO dehydrogenase maturation factor
MKLMISGKGGAGKSTVAALLAKQCAHMGQRVVVVDADVSTVLGPHRLLGIDIPQDLIGYFDGAKAVRERLKVLRQTEGSSNTPLLGTWTYDTIPDGYRSIRNSIQLVAVGKLRDTTVSCKSPWMSLARQFIFGLILTEKDRMILDAGAGIDHFGRGIDSVCDANLMVVDPSHESIRLAERALEMADSLNVPLCFVLNRTNTRTSHILRKALADTRRIIGEFAQDPALLRAGLEGRELPDEHAAAAEVWENLTTLMKSQEPARATSSTV